MTRIVEKSVSYEFGAGWDVSKYDEWPYYRNHFAQLLGENRAVDVVAVGPDRDLWLVEIKDYRVHQRLKPLDLAVEVAIKVRDTLAGIFAAAKWHSDHAHREQSQRCLAARRVRVVLHLEQPERHSKLFPRPYDPGLLQQRIKQLVRSLDPHPLVVGRGSLDALPWHAHAVGETSSS